MRLGRSVPLGPGGPSVVGDRSASQSPTGRIATATGPNPVIRFYGEDAAAAARSYLHSAGATGTVTVSAWVRPYPMVAGTGMSHACP